MNVTKPELIDLLDQIVSQIGEILANASSLSENLMPGYIHTLTKRLNGLKLKVSRDVEKLRKAKAAQKRKEELQRDNEERNETQTDVHEGRTVQVPIYNKRHQVIGWIKMLGNGTVDILNSKSQLVAREYRGLTLSNKGQFVGRGSWGLIVLGRGAG